MKYLLFVWCKRNGISRDAGLHDMCDAIDDHEAERILRAKGKNLLKYYDTVQCTIKQTEKEGIVCRFTLRTTTDRIDIGAALFDSVFPE